MQNLNLPVGRRHKENAVAAAAAAAAAAAVAVQNSIVPSEGMPGWVCLCVQMRFHSITRSRCTVSRVPTTRREQTALGNGIRFSCLNEAISCVHRPVHELSN